MCAFAFSKPASGERRSGDEQAYAWDQKHLVALRRALGLLVLLLRRDLAEKALVDGPERRLGRPRRRKRNVNPSRAVLSSSSACSSNSAGVMLQVAQDAVMIFFSAAKIDSDNESATANAICTIIARELFASFMSLLVLH